MGQYRVVITGLTPLIMHQDNIIDDRPVCAPGDPKHPGDDRFPPGIWKLGLYVANDEIVMPAANMMSALMKGGAQITVKGAKTMKAASQSVTFDEPYLSFALRAGDGPITKASIDAIDGPVFKDHQKGVEALEFQIFVCPVRMGNGARHIRCRPMFAKGWTVTGEFDVLGTPIPLETLQTLFDMSGRFAGLGDWRPSAPKKPGPYGRFSAVVTDLTAKKSKN